MFQLFCKTTQKNPNIKAMGVKSDFRHKTPVLYYTFENMHLYMKTKIS